VADRALAKRARSKAITLRYRRDRDGNWLVEVAEQPEAHTYGRSLSQARSRIREVLKLWGFPEDVEVHEDIQLPHILRDLITNTREARVELERQLERWRQRVDQTAKRLQQEGLSVRDAGELLDLSHQRIQQLRSKTPYGTRGTTSPKLRSPAAPVKRVRESTPKSAASDRSRQA
jgi:predicted RNase H-like HicB family nuclease